MLPSFKSSYKKRSPTVVRIVKRRGGNCCHKGTTFFQTNFLIKNLHKKVISHIKSIILMPKIT